MSSSSTTLSDPASLEGRLGSIHLGGIVRRAAHPKKPAGVSQRRSANGQEISRDGKRVYFTNSLYSPWDDQFYPDGVKSWMVKIDTSPKGGECDLDEKFLCRVRRVACLPGAAGRGRRFVGLLLLFGHAMTQAAGLTPDGVVDVDTPWRLPRNKSWQMGWLFAVALGMAGAKGEAR